MAKKDLFEDFGEMVEANTSLDINEILGGDPSQIIASTSDDDDADDKNKDKDDDTVLDVNRALQDTILEKDDDGEEEKVEKPEEDEADEIDESTPDQSKNIDEPPSSDVSFTVIFARDLSDRGLLSSFDEEKL